MKLDLAIIYTVVSTSWVNIESILAETRSPDRTSSSIYCVIGNLRRGVIPVGNLNKIFGDYIASVRIETLAVDIIRSKLDLFWTGKIILF